MRTRLAAVVATLGLILAACGGSSSETTADTVPVVTVPTTEATTTTASLPFGCGAVADRTISYNAAAVNQGDLAVYDAPGAAEPVSSMENPRLINGDPNAAVPLVMLVKDAPVTDDCQWVEVFLPVRPNGSSGWVKRSDVEISANPFRIETDLGDFTLTVLQDGEPIKEIDIAVASDNTPTPGGLYYITELVQTPDPGGAYGPFAYGLSGFSDVLTSFNGGPGQLGIHGTNRPELIGSKVSNGCIRMHNDDIVALSEILPLGVPVEVIA
ncbi:L,D-transpeptidase [Rhabdothermincola salaria]|uniref:L,D-transpeptidase n=1 Tax=Rhabdothermincola salaria TaxID=2903142 RepID=UPI001E4C37BD|nr:L,D-transpeptidase [Rhabdothermincola salaria]MCD9623753.1 L,D-transpeptidase [Rhabdothermincola salaria]